MRNPDKFKQWFDAVWAGSDDRPVPQSIACKGSAQYIGEYSLAHRAWNAAITANQTPSLLARIHETTTTPPNCMVVDLVGAIAIAQRSLEELADGVVRLVPDPADRENLLYETQPNFHAHILKIITENLETLATAIQQGNEDAVVEFFGKFRLTMGSKESSNG
jgi:hypothetical protein